MRYAFGPQPRRRWNVPPLVHAARSSHADGRDTAIPRRLGNQGLQRLLGTPRLQALLRIGAPQDPYEREADRVADQVLRMPEPAAQRSCVGCAGGTPCAECEDEPLAIRRMPAAPGGSLQVPDAVVGDLGAGAPLDAAARAYFEPRFGRDFGAVRIHTGPPAARSAQGVWARAFTVGRDVVFGRGEYAPGTREGRRLLAHELTHVVQQIHDTVARQPTSDETVYGPPTEEEATAEAGLLALGHALQYASRDVAVFRDLYHRGEQAIAQEIARMRAAGAAESEIARRAAAMRAANAYDVRRASGAILEKAAELFDRVRGNVARPTYDSLRAAGRSDAQIIQSALRTNRFVNRLPSGLRWVGRGLWFISAGISIYVIISAPEEERARVAAEETGAFVGGLAGGAALGAVCIATGIATGGLALIACGVLGALLGSAGGRALGRVIYENPIVLLGPAALPAALPTVGMGAGGGFRGLMERDRRRMMEMMRGGQ